MKGKIVFEGDGEGIRVEANVMFQGVIGKHEMVYQMWKAMGLHGPKDMADLTMYMIHRDATDDTTPPERTEIQIPIPKKWEEGETNEG